MNSLLTLCICTGGDLQHLLRYLTSSSLKQSDAKTPVCPRILIPIKTSTHHITNSFYSRHPIYPYRRHVVRSHFANSISDWWSGPISHPLYLSLDHRASTSLASTYCMITCASHSEASILFTPYSVRTIGYRQNFSLELNFLIRF